MPSNDKHTFKIELTSGEGRDGECGKGFSSVCNNDFFPLKKSEADMKKCQHQLNLGGGNNGVFFCTYLFV